MDAEVVDARLEVGLVEAGARGLGAQVPVEEAAGHGLDDLGLLGPRRGQPDPHGRKKTTTSQIRDQGPGMAGVE